MDRVNTLKLATDAVTQRHEHYGTPKQNFEAIANRWNAHLENVGEVGNLTAADVALMLADVKMARLENDPTHLDSWADLAGYAACGAEVSEAGEASAKIVSITSGPWRGRDLTDRIDAFLSQGHRVLMTKEQHDEFEASRREPGSFVFHPDAPFIPPVQPAQAWRSVKVGDRVRLRKGALSWGEAPLPEHVLITAENLTLGDTDGPGGYLFSSSSCAIRNEDILEILPSDAA